jgi:hypothetical protein
MGHPGYRSQRVCLAKGANVHRVSIGELFRRLGFSRSIRFSKNFNIDKNACLDKSLAFSGLYFVNVDTRSHPNGNSTLVYREMYLGMADW